MKFKTPIVEAAIIFTILCMGVVGMFVLVPIAAIQLTWNSVMSSLRFLPLINVWQATLLYFAVGALIYLSGLVHIEFEPEKIE